MRAPELPPTLKAPRHWLLTRLLGGLRNNFFAGVVVIAPIGLTVWLIWTLVGWVDGVVLPFVPRYWHPDSIVNRWLGNPRGTEEWIDVNVRGVGVVFFLVFTVLIGWIAKGLIGRSFLRWGEDVVGRVPVIRSVYNAVKQIAETIFNEQDVKFEKACLVEFPRKGVWSVAFISTPARGEVKRLLDGDAGDEVVGLFRPNTPNPATGFLIFVRRSEIVELDMTLEEAAKLVISAGLVYPGEAAGAAPPGSARPLPSPAPRPIEAPGE